MKKNMNAFNIICSAIFMILCIATIYPFIYALSYSVSDSLKAAQGGVWLLPKGFTLENYQMMFSDSRMLNATFISVSRTILGTLLHLVVTGLCGYAMSKPRFRARRPIFIFFVIPMYVSGGMIPTYMLFHDLGFINNYLVYIIPGAYATFNMFLFKLYFETIPESLEESAKLDGAGDLKVALKVYLPLSKPVLATVALFVGVGQWNSWFDALLYVPKAELHPLQMVLQTILRETQIDSMITLFQQTLDEGKKPKISPETYKMAVLIVTTLPIVFIYPFAQKYFVKGMTIGAVKL